jgi:hypothetical protein
MLNLVFVAYLHSPSDLYYLIQPIFTQKNTVKLIQLDIPHVNLELEVDDKLDYAI